MKFVSTFLSLSILSQSVSAHCESLISLPLVNFIDRIIDIWTTLIAGSTKSTGAVRLPQNNSPVTDVESADITCNVNPSPATETVSVAAGSTIGFILDNTIYHQGPAAIYLGKAPTTAADWDGSGANWFKVWNGICLPTLVTRR